MQASHHCASFTNRHPIKSLGNCLFNGTIAGSCEQGKSVHSFDSLSDMPWFMLERDKVSLAYPLASFVCTLRQRGEWVRSMVAFQRANGYTPGGEMLLYYAQRQIGKPVATSSGQIGKPALLPARLAEFFDAHMNTSCGDGVARISLDQPAVARWHALCSVASSKWREACARVASDVTPWPVVNALASTNLTCNLTRSSMTLDQQPVYFDVE